MLDVTFVVVHNAIPIIHLYLVYNIRIPFFKVHIIPTALVRRSVILKSDLIKFVSENSDSRVIKSKKKNRQRANDILYFEFVHIARPYYLLLYIN